MTWRMIRSFRDGDYPAVMRFRDPETQAHRFRWSTTGALTPQMRRQDDWYVAGWKIHVSIFPADFSKALLALKRLDERLAPRGLVCKYAISRQVYDAFTGEVKGKFFTIYCKSSDDLPPVVHSINHLFAIEGVTPVSRIKIDELDGLRHELPLTGGYAFTRYGAFCYTNGILDLTDASRNPMSDSRHLAFPRFSDPERLSKEMGTFAELILGGARCQQR